jgi:L-threonylcarbamoyladenylate synthase
MRFKLQRARAYIQSGAVIAYPTEAIYGLGCDPFNQSAVQRLLQLKQRPVQKGFILIASHPTQLLPFVDWQGDWVENVFAHWPGPYTWLLPALPNLPYWLQGKHQRIACRVTAHPLAAALCDTLGHALISTSANRSGRPAARSAFQVQQRCPGVDWVLHGALGELAQATPIYDACTGTQIR